MRRMRFLPRLASYDARMLKGARELRIPVLRL
jgi:hypothetical protein